MIDWVSALLSSWGAWVARQQDGGIGWRRVDSTCREYRGPITDQDIRLPTDLHGLDMARITEAVNDLPSGPEPLYQAVLARYVHRQSYRVMAGRFLRPESVIRRWMDSAHVAIAENLTEVVRGEKIPKPATLW